MTTPSRQEMLSNYSLMWGELGKHVRDFASAVECPVAKADANRCSSKGGRLFDIIIHLNDGHRWTRNEIADWLDTLPLNLEVRMDELPEEERTFTPMEPFIDPDPVSYKWPDKPQIHAQYTWPALYEPVKIPEAIIDLISKPGTPVIPEPAKVDLTAVLGELSLSIGALELHMTELQKALSQAATQMDQYIKDVLMKENES